MPLPESPATLGLTGGAVLALPAEDVVVYRVLRDAQPGKNDFRSDQSAGRPRGATESAVEHAGLSVWSDLDAAASIAGTFPVYIARLVVPPGQPFSIANTGPPRHYTLW